MKRLRIFMVRVGTRGHSNFHTIPPLGILYLAAYLREHFEVDLKLVDQRMDNAPNEDVARQAAEFEADIVGLSCLTANAYMLPGLSRLVREALPQAFILLGGPHPSALGARALDNTAVDVAVAGEGEVALKMVIEAYLGTRDYSAIPGLIRRDETGAPVMNPGTIPFIEDIDTLPMPAYDLIDLPRYWEIKSFGFFPKRRYVTLMSSRGCPFQCNYCHQVFGKRFRSHSVERIVEETAHFTKTYGINDIEFTDDVFNYDHDRVIEFCDQVHRRGMKLKLSFPNGFRSDSLDEEVLDALADTGLYYASFALESGSPRIQKKMGKHLDIPSFLESIEMAVKRRVFCNGYAMLGFPTETEDEVRETIRVMCDSRLHTGQFFTVTPFPGTALYNEVLQSTPEKLAHLCYDEGEYGQMYVNLSEVPDEALFAYQRKANTAFYLRPSRMLRLLRDHPNPGYLLSYVPVFIERATKGLFRRNHAAGASRSGA